MNFSKSTLLMLGASIMLASCGGGSGGGEDIVAADTNPVTDINPVSGNPEASENADVNTPDDPETGIQASANALICASNTPTAITSIGNSAHVFNAAEGQCFGRRESVVIERSLVPVVVTQEIENEGAVNLLTVEPLGRLVINRGIRSSADTFIVGVSNQQSFPVCLRDGELTGAGIEGVTLARTVEILGDTYLEGPDSDADFRFANECIPPLESRLMFGDFFSVADEEDGESFPDFTQIELELTLILPTESAVATEALTPGEFTWSVSQSADVFNTFPYTSSITVLNLTETAVPLTTTADILYLDNEGFLIRANRVRIRNLIDNSIVFSGEGTVASAMGGMITYFTGEGELTSSVNGNTEFGGLLSGPATQVIVYAPRLRVASSF